MAKMTPTEKKEYDEQVVHDEWNKKAAFHEKNLQSGISKSSKLDGTYLHLYTPIYI